MPSCYHYEKESLKLMKLHHPQIYNINHFEGPLDLLWHLIQRDEMNIFEVQIHEITKQYLAKLRELDLEVDQGAEFIASASALLWLKSKTLLPKHEQEELTAEEEHDPRFEIIHQLIDYCRFKQAAKELSDREQQQSAFYPRGVEETEVKKNLGIDHLSLEDLAVMFRQVLSKTAEQKGVICEEVWRVSDKIKAIRGLLLKIQKIPFDMIFNAEKSRGELIVTFLALLELMKMGEAKVRMDTKEQTVYITIGVNDG